MINSIQVIGNSIYSAICVCMLQHYFKNCKVIYEDPLILSGIVSAKPSFLQAIRPFTSDNFDFDLHKVLYMQDWIVAGQDFEYLFGDGVHGACSFDQKNLLENLNIKPSHEIDNYDFTITFNDIESQKEQSNILNNIDYVCKTKKSKLFSSKACSNGWTYNIPYKSKSVEIAYTYDIESHSSFSWPKVFLSKDKLNLDMNILEIHPVKTFIYIFLIKLFVNYLIKFTMVDEHFIRNYNLYATKLLHGVNAYMSAHIVFSQRFENFFSKHDRQNSSWNELLVDSQFRDDGNIFGPKDWNLLAKNLKVVV